MSGLSVSGFSLHAVLNEAFHIPWPHLLPLALPLSAVFEEPEDPSARSFFSEIISSVSDVKFSHSGRYLLTRDYLTAKVWDLNMESKPLETYQVCDPSPGTTIALFFWFCSICVASTDTHTHTQFDTVTKFYFFFPEQC